MSTTNNPPSANITTDPIGSLVKISNVYYNVSQKVIITTEDKVHLCLLKHLSSLEKRRGWLIPLGILIPLIVTLITTDFKYSLGMDASVWKSIFIIGCIISFTWLLFSCYKAFRATKMENIIDELKEGSETILKS